MAIDPTSPVTTAVTPGSQSQNQGSTLGKDDFLKILVGEMQNMDPMDSSSQDPTQSVTQMTQYSILEQLQNMSSSEDQQLVSTQQTQTLALLGKTVDYTGADGSPTSGLVQKVDFAADGSAQLTIDGVTGVNPSKITGVQ
ncbi:MAG TPA: flagellar hook capping FlgD N-terminal domain-containing protein [Thermoleophilaceae bacterium]|jgi:flagellar basal-body rod modification protein FlgD